MREGFTYGVDEDGRDCWAMMMMLGRRGKGYWLSIGRFGSRTELGYRSRLRESYQRVCVDHRAKVEVEGWEGGRESYRCRDKPRQSRRSNRPPYKLLFYILHVRPGQRGFS